MLLAQVFGWTLFIFGLLLSFQGIWLLSRAMWPMRVSEAADRVRRNAFRCFLIGLPITFVVAIVTAALARRLGAPGQAIGFAFFCFYFLFANVGVAGLATHIG